MGTKVPIMVDLISQITGLPKARFDPSQYFKGKDNDKKLAARLKKKYDVIHNKRVYVNDTINDKVVRIVGKLLPMKIVHKKRKNQCTSRVIACAEQ